MGRTLVYTSTLLPRLSRYVLDGRYNIDNNGIENAIRPLALGRKNFLFAGNHDTAIRAAIVPVQLLQSSRHQYQILAGGCPEKDTHGKEYGNVTARSLDGY